MKTRLGRLKEIRVSGSDYKELVGYFQRDGNREKLAFCLAGLMESDRRVAFLVKKVILARPVDMKISSNVYLEAQPTFLCRVLSEAKRTGLHLIGIHNHPFCLGIPCFSHVDDDNDLREFLFLNEIMPQHRMVSVVVGNNDNYFQFDGRYWSREETAALPIHIFRVMDVPVVEIPSRFYSQVAITRSSLVQKGVLASLSPSFAEIYSRQVLALTMEFQKKLSQVRVGIVGCGGVGSVVAITLAHTGVGSLTLVDDDFVEMSNLNRLLGARLEDAIQKVPKVDAIARMCKEVSPNVKVEPICQPVTSADSISLLKSTDALFGCVDNDFARAVINKIATQYMINFLDTGVGIRLDSKSSISDIGGQVRVILPSGPCLECTGGLDKSTVAQGLLTEEEREMRTNVGYGLGPQEPAPAVMALNSIIANLACMEFLNMYSGFKPLHNWIMFNGRDSRLKGFSLKKNERCVTCGQDSTSRFGDLEELSFHSHLPANMPWLNKM
jgi:molybdopterin/thiamine biosynthesis adenylyltransferase